MNQSKLFTFTFTEDEANQVIQILAEKPWSQVNPIIQKMYAQAAEQDQPRPTDGLPPVDISAVSTNK